MDSRSAFFRRLRQGLRAAAHRNGAAAAFGGLSASLAELLSSSSVLGKDAFTSSMHSAVYENIQ